MNLYIDYSKILRQSRLSRQQLAQKTIQHIASRVVPISIPIELKTKIVRDFIVPKRFSKLSTVAFYVSLQLTLLLTGTRTILNYFFPRFILQVTSWINTQVEWEKNIGLKVMAFDDDFLMTYSHEVVFPQTKTQRLGNILFYIFSRFPMIDPQLILDYSMDQYRNISTQVLYDFVEERNFRLKLYSPESVAKISFIRYLDTHIKDKWSTAEQKKLTTKPLKFDVTLRDLAGR
jgi:hypothetical protein